MEHMRRLIALTAVAAMLLMGLVSVALAQPSDLSPATPHRAATTLVKDMRPAGVEEFAPVKLVTPKAGNAILGEGEIPVDLDDAEHEAFEGEECFVDWGPSEEEISEINAETDALVAHLEGLGFTVTVATDELGIRYVDFEAMGDDEALWTAIDQFHQTQWAEEVATWSDAEKAEWNAHIEEFVAELAAEGITVETEEIAPGVIDIIWTEDLEIALWELEEKEFEDGFEDDWVPSEEEIAAINAETDALVAHLDGLGFTVTVATDELGIRYVDFEAMGDDEALWTAVDQFHQTQWAEEVATWSDAEKAEWNAHIEEFVAELAAEGITVETEEIAPGVIDIVWTEELEMALAELEGEWFPFEDHECEEWDPSPDEIAEINAETDALVAHLEGLGFTVRVGTDELGIRYVDFEAMGDDEALWVAAEEFYHQTFAEEVATWSDAEKAEWNAHIEDFIAELAAEGITVETEEIAPGVIDIVWTEDLEMAIDALEGDELGTNLDD